MKKQMIVWKAKHDDQYFDATTPEKEAKAFLEIFEIMEEQGDYEACPPLKEHKALYKKAKAGDAPAAKAFLMARSNAGYEYEIIEIKTLK